MALLWTSAHPAHMRELAKAKAAARRAGKLRSEPDDVTSWASQTSNSAPSRNSLNSTGRTLILTFFDYRTLAYRNMIAELAVNQRLPTIFSSRLFVDAGGLMSYGRGCSRKASVVWRATWTELSGGAKQSELPVEQPTALRTCGWVTLNRDDPRN